MHPMRDGSHLERGGPGNDGGLEVKTNIRWKNQNSMRCPYCDGVINAVMLPKAPITYNLECEDCKTVWKVED